jgi:hypothetical protein
MISGEMTTRTIERLLAEDAGSDRPPPSV